MRQQSIGNHEGRPLRRMTMRYEVWAIGVALVAAACGAAPGGGPDTTVPAPETTAIVRPTTTAVGNSDLAALEDARARWAAAGLDTLSYVFEDDCGECMPTTARVVVWEGEMASAFEALSVDEVFDEIEAAIASGRDVDVVYDETLGFPAEVWVDREARAYDGGTHWLIRDLSAGLPGDPASLDALAAARDRWQATKPPAYEYRTRIVCGCELDGTLWTTVQGDRVTNFETTVGSDTNVSPTTIDRLLDDLEELFTTGVAEEGVRIDGSASFDPVYGHPSWIGLDISVEDPSSELALLPPRIVFLVDGFRPIPPTVESDFGTSSTDLDAARERWSASGMIDYTYELTVHDIETATFGDPLTVTVTNGAVAEITQDGAAVDPSTVPAYSIEQLFDFIALWSQSGIEVEALYHERDGHPVVVVRRGDSPLVISIGELLES